MSFMCIIDFPSFVLGVQGSHTLDFGEGGDGDGNDDGQTDEDDCAAYLFAFTIIQQQFLHRDTTLLPQWYHAP